MCVFAACLNLCVCISLCMCCRNWLTAILITLSFPFVCFVWIIGRIESGLIKKGWMDEWYWGNHKRIEGGRGGVWVSERASACCYKLKMSCACASFMADIGGDHWRCWTDLGHRLINVGTGQRRRRSKISWGFTQVFSLSLSLSLSLEYLSCEWRMEGKQVVLCWWLLLLCTWFMTHVKHIALCCIYVLDCSLANKSGVMISGFDRASGMCCSLTQHLPVGGLHYNTTRNEWECFFCKLLFRLHQNFTCRLYALHYSILYSHWLEVISMLSQDVWGIYAVGSFIWTAHIVWKEQVHALYELDVPVGIEWVRGGGAFIILGHVDGV